MNITTMQESINGFTSWPQVLFLLVFIGILLYFGYQYGYDRNLNAALFGKTVRNLPAPISVLSVYAVLAGAFILILFAMNTQPKEPEIKSCYTIDSNLDLNANEHTIKEELQNMEKLKSKESVSYHEQELKSGIRMQYSIKNKKDYVYIISYERAATDLKEYYYIELQDIFGGKYAMNIIMNPKDKKLYVMIRGTMQESCDASELKLDLRNVTEGKNRNPVHEEISFTVENGGIRNENK